MKPLSEFDWLNFLSGLAPVALLILLAIVALNGGR